MSTPLTIQNFYKQSFTKTFPHRKKLIHSSHSISFLILMLALVSVYLTTHQQAADYVMNEKQTPVAANTKGSTAEEADNYYEINKTFVNKFGEGHLENR